MKSTPRGLLKHLAEMKDPRRGPAQLHLLSDIMGLTIMAVLCGVEDWVGIELWGRSHEVWLRTLLELPEGIPSHDTLGRVFAALEPDAFRTVFSAWVQDVTTLSAGEVVAIDGKTLRRSFNTASGRSAIHMVSAWAHKNQMVLGQVKTADHSNEITAVPKLLELLVLKGCIVTMDAMHCQKETARQINEKGADYILSLKHNQLNTLKDVATHFTEAEKESWRTGKFYRVATANKGHGRVEEREYVVSGNLHGLDEVRAWPGLQSVVRVTRTRHLQDKSTTEVQYFLSSLKPARARQIARGIRAHWSVENQLHWCLDVQFNEDQSRVRTDNAPENMAMVRHIALSLLKQDTSVKAGLKNKRVVAAANRDYLIKVMSG